MAVKEWFRRFQPLQLYLVIFFTVAFFIVEIIASHCTHALTLLLNAYHMLCNIIALFGCFASIKYSSQEKTRHGIDCSSDDVSSICINEAKKGSSKSSLARDTKQSCSDRRMKNTFGWARIDILTMLVCCVFLASFCFSLLAEALQTLVHIDHHDAMHHPLPVMFIGISGIILNGFCYVIIGGYTFNQGLFLHVTHEGNLVLQSNLLNTKGGGEEQLTASTRSSPIAMPRRQGFREVCRDVIGCVIVVITSVLVYLTDPTIAKFIDPIFAIISAILLFVLSYPYLKESCMILLQTIPNHINIESLKKDLLAEFPGIVNVHDFHVWHLAGTKVISTVHIIFLDPMIYISTMDQVSEFFVKVGITQVTIQPEFYEPNAKKPDCLIRCRGKKCFQSQCCSEDELLDEIITKSDKCMHPINKRLVKREIIPASSEVDLTKFKLHRSESTKSIQPKSSGNSKCAQTHDHRHSCPENSILVINVDVNCQCSTDDEMVGDETPCSTMAF